MHALLKRFVEDELEPRLPGRIEPTIHEAHIDTSIAVREFPGNTVSIVLNFEPRTAVVDDVLDSGAHSTLTMPLGEFLVAIGAREY